MRGPGVHELGLPIPARGRPGAGAGSPRLALVRGGRPVKRWRYVGAFGPGLMLCAGEAWVGPLRQRWWALAEPAAPIVEWTSLGSAGLELAPGDDGPDSRITCVRVAARGVRVELEIDARDVEPIEIASPAGPGWIWTRKQAGAVARGSVELRGRRREVRLDAVIDDSAGYHERHTSWRWCSGVGRGRGGERLAWNLVSGVHDSPQASERTLWVDGHAEELGPVAFSPDLGGLRIAGGGRLSFTAWAAREHRTNLLLLRNSYRQPFGEFSGTLPGGLALSEGYGVMEEHDAWW